MAYINDWESRFRKGVASSPFEHINAPGNQFATLGIEWCPRCRMEVDCDTQAEHRGTTYVSKRTCNRCGKVVKYGIFHNVPLLSDTPLQDVALEWVTEPGVDRRGPHKRRSR